MRKQVPRELLEMSQEDVRDWLYSDLDEIIDTEYPEEEKGR